jgi:hypothetical protein
MLLERIDKQQEQQLSQKVSAGQAVKQTIKERCESNVSPAFLVR